jgi:hypothetical protein
MRVFVLVRTLALPLAVALPALIAACGGGEPGPATTPTVTPARAPSRTPVPTRSPTPTPTPAATPTPPRAKFEPTGFPLRASLRVNLVIGKKGSRQIATAEGPALADYAEVNQPGDDPVAANAGGWNCRTHQEYEGKPAVDWYVPEGQPVYATLDGGATLYIVTTVNSFDYYGVDREPYYGDPDRARAPTDPFAGRPGGGKGVFVQVENERYVAGYGHLSLSRTLEAVPSGAFIEPYGPAFDYAGTFGVPRRFDEFDAVARWEVRAGDVIGYTGDTGYSEAPHLHYELAARGPEPAGLCPTREEGFGESGWLFR